MNNQKEIYEALLAGETLVMSQTKKLFKLNELGEIDCINNATWSVPQFGRPMDWQIYTKPEWYENIPEGGVLCKWAGKMLLITDYIPHHENPLKGNCSRSVNEAIPCTKQEIQIFMDNAPEDL